MFCRIQMQAKEAETNHVKQVPTSMFFAHNTALGPPYHVLIDTNFINFSIKVFLGFFSSWFGLVFERVASHRVTLLLLHNLGRNFMTIQLTAVIETVTSMSLRSPVSNVGKFRL